MPHKINPANRAYRERFVRDMKLLKPKKSQYPRGGYGAAYKAWQRSFNFGKALHHKINDINNALQRRSGH